MNNKILHAAETIKGGVATVVELLVKSQTELGSEVSFLVPKDQVRELSSLSTSRAIAFKRSGRSLRSCAYFAWALAFELLKNKPHIVHLHSSFAGIIGRLVVLLLRPIYRPAVIYTPHAWSFIMDVSETKKSFFAWIERLLLPACDAVICGSNFEKNEAIRYGLNASRIAVIYNGVSAPVKNNRLLNESGPVRLLFVGRLDYQKGFDVLLRAMQLLDPDEFKLTVVGGAVHDRSEASSTVSNINYSGWVDRADLCHFFLEADILVMPSRWESFGLVAAEAHSYGLGVLASRTCSIPEIVSENESGLLFEKDSADDMVRNLVQTPIERWRKFGAEGYRRYERLFRAEDMCEAVNKIYKEVSAPSH
ncbi:MAG: glycosyltransferase [Luteimonas sp.]